MLNGRLFPNSPVMSLFKWSGPSRIPRLVIPVFVRVAVNGVLICWGWSHVGKERAEIVPSIADSDAGSAPIFPLPEPRVITPFAHMLPRAIFFSALIACRSAVLGARKANDITLQTPTGSRIATSQRANGKNNVLSAFAAAKPLSSLQCFDVGNGYEPAESLVMNIGRGWH